MKKIIFFAVLLSIIAYGMFSNYRAKLNESDIPNLSYYTNTQTIL